MQIHDDVSTHKLDCAPKYAVALSRLFTCLYGYEDPRLLRHNFVRYINYVYANLTIYLCYFYTYNIQMLHTLILFDYIF